jgi:hypothetical protein
MSVSVSVCSKQTKVGLFNFPFAENKRKLLLSVRFIFLCGNSETWRHGHRVLETWRHGDGDMEMETWKRGDIDMETTKHGEMETWRHESMNKETCRHQTDNGRQYFLIRFPFANCANGSSSFVRLLTKKETEVICLQTD